MANLILLTNFFPYGNQEPYLETEIKYYDDYFDNIIVASLQVREEQLKTRRSFPSPKFKVCYVEKASNIKYILNSVRVLFDKEFYKETYRLASKRQLNPTRFIALMVYLSRSHYEASKLQSQLRRMGIDRTDRTIFYSYRFEYQPYVGLLLKREFPNSSIICRGHGYDLHEYRHPGRYIPLRESLLDNIDKAVMIGHNGIEYLDSEHPGHSDKIVLSRLGTLDHGIGPVPSGECIRIVSCSAIVKVKRLHLIIESLSPIKDRKIEWHHYGSGPLESEIKKMADEKLGDNIRCIFHGHVDNVLMMREYEQQAFDTFVNVSSSEGVPVSIMEAMSFGIPILATDVGGTSEIVTDGYSGSLLPKEFDAIQFREGLIRIYENKAMRTNARNEWNEKSNADRLYPSFIESILLS